MASRSLFLLAIAICATQVFAQYQPKCQSTVMYVLSVSPYGYGLSNSVLDGMASTTNFSYIDVSNPTDFHYTSNDWGVGSTSFSVATLNWIAGDIPTRYIAPGTRIVLLVTGNTYYLTDWDSASAVVVAANRLKEAHNVEIFVADIANNRNNMDDFTFKVAQDIASNPVQSHLFYADNLDQLPVYLTGASSSAFASIGDPYIRTLDGNIYNFQGLGEYTLYRGVDYETQVRMAPCDNSNPSARTCNRAIAIKSLDTYNVFELHYDPIAQYLTVYGNGNLQDVTLDALYQGNWYFGEYNLWLQKFDTPIDSDSIFLARIGTDTNTYFQVTFGLKVGLAFAAYVDPQNFGRVQGLAGTWDGCADNDYYSQNQTYTSPSASGSDIYYNFAQSWRVNEQESIFTHGVNAKYYMPHYADYSPQWHPAMSGVQASANAPGDCAFFKDIAPLLYSACLDDVSKGNGDIRPIGYLLATIACGEYCSGGFNYFGYVSDAYCASTCETQNDLDFHANYTVLNSDTYTLVPTPVGATFSATLGGTYTYTLTSDFCPNAAVTGTVQITCDQPPQVSAGDDRVVKRSPHYWWPNVVLMGSVSDQNNADLEYSWTLISAPVVGNVSAGSFGPYLPTSNTPDIMNPQSLTPYFWPQYPGDYVLELAVFDGCFIAKDRVTVHLECSDCKLYVESAGIQDQTYESTVTPNSNTWQVVSSFSTGMTLFDYYYADWSVDVHWFIDSNSRGYNFTYPTPSSTDLYSFTVTPAEQFLYMNTTTAVVPTHTQVNTTASVNTGNILRYEALGHIKTENFTTQTTTTTVEHFSSVPIPVTMCQIRISSASGYNPTFTVVSDLSANVSRPFTQAPACVGDYTVRAAARDECQSAYDLTNLHLGCSEQPQAHLITCTKTLKFDYVTKTFPSIQMNGMDTFDPDTTNLLYQWEVVNPSGQMSYLCTGTPDLYTHAYVNCQTPTFQPLGSAGAGTYNITMWVSDGCTYDYESTTIVTQCDPLTATAFAEDVTQDTVAPAHATVNFTAQFTTQHPAAVTSSWTLVSAPVNYDLTPLTARPSTFITSTNATTGVYVGGSYTYMYDAFDGCTNAGENVTFTYTCSNSMSFTLGADLPTQDYSAGSLYQIVTVTVNLNETVNTNSSRVQYKPFLIAKPLGSAVSVNPGWISFNGGANPTFTFRPDVPGTYTVQVYVWDNCNFVAQNISVTATCTAQVPTINGVQPSYVVPSFAQATIDLAISDSFANYSMTWALTNAANQTTILYLNSFGRTNITFSVPAGVFTVTVAANTGASGCVALSAPVTIQANCNFTLGVDTQGTFTSPMVRGKFSRVTISPTFSGVDPTYPPQDSLLGTYYEWRFLAAPYASVFAPSSNNVTTTTFSSTKTGYVYNGNGQWIRTTTNVTTTRTQVNTKWVTLNYDASSFDACFAPDVDGTYLLQFSINDYCGNIITQTFTVTAACNAAPTANAGSAATYSFDGTGFVNAGGYKFTAIPLNGSAADTDGDFLDYQWTVISHPNSTFGTTYINNPNSKLASFVPFTVGTYVLQFSATDGCSTANSTVTITVGCPNNYQVNAPISFTFDGFTPIALQEFSLLANPQCTRSWTWDVTRYDPSSAIPPVSATTEAPKSGASQIAIPAFLIAFLTLFVRMF